MGTLLVTGLGLGLAGIDPAGALIAFAALTAGARDRTVVLFGLVALLGTSLLGTTLSLTLGARLGDVDWWGLVPSGRAGAVVELVISALLLGWAVTRLVRARAQPIKPREGRTGTAGLVGVGALFALSAALDPTFVALVVLAGRDQEVAAVALAHGVWALVSQLPLVLLLIAIAAGKHERVVARFGDWWDRARPVVRVLVTGALILVAVVLGIDGAWWFVTGEFLLPDPS